MKSLINENRFFEEVIPFIGEHEKIIEELIENATRAGADDINVTLTDERLVVENNGAVLNDWLSLLTVASTGHSKDVIESQHPAGMGIMLCLSATDKAVFHSGNKRLEVDCLRFFSDVNYRVSLLDLLENPEKMEVDEYVDGMRCEFDDKNGLFSSLLAEKSTNVSIKYDLYSAFGYYPGTITFNNELIEKKNVDWYFKKEGTGDLAGTTFGIEKEGYSERRYGKVYWFGKRILCEELAPFSIVVNHPTPVLRPTLPDRLNLSNNESVLKNLKTQMELDSKDDIQQLTDKVGDVICYQMLFHILKKLDISLNVEHFTRWLSCVKDYDDNVVVRISDLDLCTDEFDNFIVDGHRATLDDVMPDNMTVVFNKIGQCDMPSSLKKVFHDEIDIVTEKHPNNDLHNGTFGDTNAKVCTRIEANGIPIDYFYFECFAYIVEDADIDELSYDLERYHCLLDTHAEGHEDSDKYLEDWQLILNSVKESYSARKLMTTINRLVGYTAEGITKVTLDLESKSMDVQCGDKSRQFALVDID